jgi:hypothetical protein
MTEDLLMNMVFPSGPGEKKHLGNMTIDELRFAEGRHRKLAAFLNALAENMESETTTEPPTTPIPTTSKAWTSYSPMDEWLFYEGTDPVGFAAEMLAEFGIDVRRPKDPDRWQRGMCFFIPPGQIEAVYGPGRWGHDRHRRRP